MSRINKFKIRELWESKRNKLEAVNTILEGLGLQDSEGNSYRDAKGNRVLKKDAPLKADDFSLREMAEGIFGQRFSSFVDPQSTGVNNRALLEAADKQARGGSYKVSLLEDGGMGYSVDPSSMQQISGYSILSGGLIEAKILEQFQHPRFIADALMETVPTKLNGQKIIQVQNLNPNNVAKRAPGESHPRVMMGGQYVATPETYELALAIDVSREAVFFDLTNQVLTQAATIGQQIAYQKELDCLNVVIGANNSFNWNGTFYNTYSNQIATLGYNSVLTSNPLIDWQSLQAAWLQLSRNLDPANLQRRILSEPDVLLCPPSLLATASLILNATLTERVTGVGSPAENRAFTDGTPFYQQYKILSSPLLEQQLLAAGLNQTQADASWFLIDSKAAFKIMENIPLQVQQAATSSYGMLDRGTIASYFASMRFTPSVWSPWKTLSCPG